MAMAGLRTMGHAARPASPAALAGAMFLAAALAAGGAEPAPEVAVFGKVERSAGNQALGIAGQLNPYDPDDVKVDAEIVFPDGSKKRLPCFWYVPCEPYVVEAPGDDPQAVKRWERFRPAETGEWRFRFSPPAAGDYSYTFMVEVKGKPGPARPGGTFAARATDDAGAGPIRLGKDGRGFRHAGGRPFIPIGHNLGWPEESGAAGYGEWLKELSAAGGNATRLWLTHYLGGTALEWSASKQNSGYAGAGRYSQEAAWRVDRILESAGERGVWVMLCFFSFGDHNWDWRDHPYGKAAGGWLAKPAEFFTDARARAAVRKMLRYAAARWGWSPNLWAWELWNEVETSQGYQEDAVTAWHKEMAAWLRQADAHGHLVTTSYRFTPPDTPCAAYGLAEIDFAQVHMYGPQLLSSLETYTRAAAKFGKPVVVGEYGLWVTPNYFEADPAGLHLHDGNWGGVFTGGAGSGMSWWWERYIHPRGLCFHHAGLARFLKDESLEDARPAVCLVRKSPEKHFAYALRTRDAAWGWVGLVRQARWEGAADTFQLKAYGGEAAGGPLEVWLEGDFKGEREIFFYDTFDGVMVGRAAAAGTEQGIAVTLPAFRHDLAFKCRRIGAGPAWPAEKPLTPIHDRFVKLQESGGGGGKPR